VTTWLIDKSALVRLAVSSDAEQWTTRIERGMVRMTNVTRLEVGYSARSGPDLRAGLREAPLAAMPVEYLTPAIEDRAMEVLTLLADRGQHRGPSIPDLIIAATAELARLTVLHLDKDFEIIAEITGQPLERLILQRHLGERGSLKASTLADAQLAAGRPDDARGVFAALVGVKTTPDAWRPRAATAIVSAP
jgi:hypothetical protein